MGLFSRSTLMSSPMYLDGSTRTDGVLRPYPVDENIENICNNVQQTKHEQFSSVMYIPMIPATKLTDARQTSL